MRRVAIVPRTDLETKRVILHDTGRSGTFLYLCRSIEDTGGYADEWYESAAHATAACSDRFGIQEEMWNDVPDPEPGCQHDWIAPVRVRGRVEGKPQWGEFERREGDRWVPFDKGLAR